MGGRKNQFSGLAKSIFLWRGPKIESGNRDIRFFCNNRGIDGMQSECSSQRVYKGDGKESGGRERGEWDGIGPMDEANLGEAKIVSVQTLGKSGSPYRMQGGAKESAAQASIFLACSPSLDLFPQQPLLVFYLGARLLEKLMEPTCYPHSLPPSPPRGKNGVVLVLGLV